jgi:hypothetical protein
MEVVRRFLLHAVDSYETRNEAGPTVSELAADLGLPADFGHKHLVDHLRSEAALEHLANYRGRFTLTPAGRLALDVDEARGHAPARQRVPIAESALSGRRG